MATGRSRAYNENPYWATALTSMVGGNTQPMTGVAGIVVALWALIKRSPLLVGLLWMGSGWRPGSKEHGEGRAIDIIVSRDVGVVPNAQERAAALGLINFLIKHAKALGIQWILFSRDGKPRTESWNVDRGTWKALANRGSVPANHVDHIHVYFKTGASWPAFLNSVSLGAANPTPAPSKPAPTAPTRPGVPSSGVSNPYPGRNAFKLGQTHSAVTLLGQRLVAHGYGSFYKVGPGPRFTEVDRKAVQAFQKAQGWSGSDADGYPGPETWARLMAAPKKATVAASSLKKGSKGAAVTKLQVGLNKVFPAYSKLKVDGVFGSATERVVREFQKRSKLTVDGIVGTRTKAALAKYGIRV